MRELTVDIGVQEELTDREGAVGAGVLFVWAPPWPRAVMAGVAAFEGRSVEVVEGEYCDGGQWPGSGRERGQHLSGGSVVGGEVGIVRRVGMRLRSRAGGHVWGRWWSTAITEGGRGSGPRSRTFVFVSGHTAQCLARRRTRHEAQRLDEGREPMNGPRPSAQTT